MGYTQESIDIWGNIRSKIINVCCHTIKRLKLPTNSNCQLTRKTSSIGPGTVPIYPADHSWRFSGCYMAYVSDLKELAFTNTFLFLLLQISKSESECTLSRLLTEFRAEVCNVFLVLDRDFFLNVFSRVLYWLLGTVMGKYRPSWVCFVRSKRSKVHTISSPGRYSPSTALVLEK